MRKILKIATLSVLLALTASTSSYAQTFSSGFAGFGSNSGDPIEIEASELQVEDKNNKAIFTGNVVVIQGTAVLKTHQLHVFYDGESSGEDQQQRDISRLEASGGVQVTSQDQVATGDHATFDMKTEIMVMTGSQVTLTQGDNVVTGNKLVVNLKTGKADLKAPKTGRVRVLLKPNSVNQN